MRIIDSLWTPDQVVLSILLVTCAVILVRRPPAPVPNGPRVAAGRGASAAFWCCFALVAAFLAWRGGVPIGIRVDSWSDANVVISGRQYARDGLFKHCAAAQHQIVTTLNPPDPFYLYTRYPVGSNLVNGALRLAGATSDRVYRIPPVVCSLASLLVWRRIFRRFSTPAFASFAAALLATSYGFLAYADNLHYHAYAFLMTAAAVECFLRWASAESRRRRWLLASAGLTFLGACFTWEYHLWIILFIISYLYFFKPAIGRRWVAVWIGALLLALTLQILQRRCTLASSGVIPDSTGPSGGFLADVFRRTIGFEAADDTPEGVTLLTYPKHLALHFYKFYGIPLLGLGAMFLLVLRRPRDQGPQVREGPEPLEARFRVFANGSTARDSPDGGCEKGFSHQGFSHQLVYERPEPVRFLFVLCIAGVGWWAIMMQHSSVHPHVMRLALPTSVWLIALALQGCWESFRNAALPAWVRAAALLLLATVAFIHCEGTVANVRLHAQPDWLDRRERCDAGPSEAKLFSRLRDVIPAGAVILTNHNRLPFMRLWSGRPVYPAGLVYWPPSKEKGGRFQIEIAINHLRELYLEQLPPVYYVYNPTYEKLDERYRRDALLRLMLSGTVDQTPNGWGRDQVALSEAITAGRSARSFCPIVDMTGNFICFKFDPALAVIRKEFEVFGYPSIGQFGPMP